MTARWHGCVPDGKGGHRRRSQLNGSQLNTLGGLLGISEDRLLMIENIVLG